MNGRLLSRELNNLESDWGLFLYENEGEIYLYVEQTRADRNPKFFCHIVVSLSCHRGKPTLVIGDNSAIFSLV